MYSRLLKKPLQNQKSFYLFGPRGTGKTTWSHQCCPESVYIDLLEGSLYNTLLARPERLEKLIPPNNKEWIVIDEIQRVPTLLNEVHRLIEKFQYKFILTGSSARNLRKKGTNLLGGRALTYHMYPLTAVELGSDFILDNSLKFGHLPSIFSEERPMEYLKAYVQTYLREEVLQESLTRNLQGFARFLEIASFSQGSVLNITAVSRETGIERKTVSNYFTILEDILLADRLPVFTKRAKRRLMSHSKFYYFDAGVYRALRPSGPLDSPEEIEGAGLETLLFQELKSINEYFSLDYSLYYWRTSTGLEVDFVLYGPGGLLAFEVKHSNRFSNRDLNGLRAFKKDYPEAKCFFLYRGERKEYWNDIEILPVQQALPSLPEILENKR